MTFQKIKVALICHFSTIKLQRKLAVKKNINAFAPWISAMIKEFETRDDIEIHVVAPHYHLSENRQFHEKGIYYHFLKIGVPFFNRPWPRIFRWDSYTNYWNNSRRIQNVVKKIKPDIVHLFGAENAYYSSSILGFLDMPHFISVQGFLFLQANLKTTSSIDIKKRLITEQKIYQRAKYFGINYPYMKDEIERFNKNGRFFSYYIPREIYIPSNTEKKYDLVFFARICREKGVEDFLKVVTAIKNENKNIQARIIGAGAPNYIKRLKQICFEEKINDNVEFLGHISDFEELHKIVSEAKICVLPTYNDVLPGTIIESLFLKTAVVTYATGGIPTLNSQSKNIELVKTGNVEELISTTGKLLSDDIYRVELVESAYNYVVKHYNNKKEVDKIVKAYHEIIDEFKTKSDN